MKFFLILFLMVLSGCTDTICQEVPGIGPYLETLKGYGLDASHTQICSVVFDKRNSAGICNWKTRIVSINIEYWDQINDTKRELLLLHEFGHCVLGRKHRNYEFIEGTESYPGSIMHHHILRIPDWYYLENKDYYLDELFNFED